MVFLLNLLFMLDCVGLSPLCVCACVHMSTYMCSLSQKNWQKCACAHVRVIVTKNLAKNVQCVCLNVQQAKSCFIALRLYGSILNRISMSPKGQIVIPFSPFCSLSLSLPPSHWLALSFSPLSFLNKFNFLSTGGWIPFF